MTSKKNLVALTQLSILVAIIAVMSFTPLGYLKVGLIEITLIPIPVVIGAIVLGPMAGAILGGVFGITSFIQCFGMSAFGVALFEINPIFTAILCIIPRILVGLFAGLIFKGISKFDKSNYVACGATGLMGALINTFLFVGGLILFFGKSQLILDMQGGQSLLAFFVAFIGINGVVEAIATCIVGGAIGKVLLVISKKRQPA